MVVEGVVMVNRKGIAENQRDSEERKEEEDDSKRVKRESHFELHSHCSKVKNPTN